MSIISDYCEAQVKLDDLAIELENYLEEIKPKVDRTFELVFGTVYNLESEDIDWGYIVDENYNRVGIEADCIQVMLNISKIGLYTDFYFEPDKLDDPEWIESLIEDELLNKESEDNQALEKVAKSKREAKEKIEQLAKKYNLNVTLND